MDGGIVAAGFLMMFPGAFIISGAFGFALMFWRASLWWLGLLGLAAYIGFTSWILSQFSTATESARWLGVHLLLMGPGVVLGLLFGGALGYGFGKFDAPKGWSPEEEPAPSTMAERREQRSKHNQPYRL